MGGLVFASGDNPLYTPRMSPAVYRVVRERCSQILRQVFVVVATPIEGPAKKDFGDIDFFLAWARDDIFPSSTATPPTNTNSAQTRTNNIYGGNNAHLETVKRLLGAVRSKEEQSGVAAIAIPWPDDLLPQAAVIGTDQEAPGSDDDGTAQRYIQVDMHVCGSLEHLQWMLFKHAHGDLWNLLGSTIRPLGLTVDETGMWVRIPEIEALNRNQAKVLLTREPAAILGFLGLTHGGGGGGEWEEPFGSAEEVFEYAASCRLFWVRPAAADEDASDEDGAAAGSGRRKLKSNDRRRMNQRPLFRKWVDEFLPRCRAEGRFAAAATAATRAQVRDEAFAAFPGAQREYASRLWAWRVQRQREHLWRDVIKAALPAATTVAAEDVDGGGDDDVDASSGNKDRNDEDGGSGSGNGNGGISPHYRSCAASALKKIILADDASFGIEPPGASVRSSPSSSPSPLSSSSPLFDEDKVRAWVAAHWREVGDAAWRLNQARYAESLERKKKEDDNNNGDNNNKEE